MKKNRIGFLDLIIPFVVAYSFMSILVFNLKLNERVGFLFCVLLSLSSFLLMYGLFAFLRDFNHVLSDLSINIFNLFKKIIKYENDKNI